MTSSFSWQNCNQPLSCFILYSKAKFASYARYFLISYFCIPVPYNVKDIVFGCQFQKALQVFIEPFNFSFFSITGCGIGLDYYGIEWFALEMNRDHSVIFEVASKYCILGSLAWYSSNYFILSDIVQFCSSFLQISHLAPHPWDFDSYLLFIFVSRLV